jgi:hypothetical protein
MKEGRKEGKEGGREGRRDGGKKKERTKLKGIRDNSVSKRKLKDD